MQNRITAAQAHSLNYLLSSEGLEGDNEATLKFLRGQGAESVLEVEFLSVDLDEPLYAVIREDGEIQK